MTAAPERARRGERSRGASVAVAAFLLVLAAIGTSVSPPAVSGAVVDGVAPRPRLYFAPGEYHQFLSELDGPRRAALDRLITYVDEQGLDSWNERDLQLESQALIARALLDRGDARGATYLTYARNTLRRRFLSSHTYERWSDSHEIVTDGYRWLEAVALAHDWLHPRWTSAERDEIASWLRDEIDHWVDRDRLRRASPSPFRNDAARGVQGLLAASLTLFDEPGMRSTAERGIGYAWPYYESILAAHQYAGRGGGMAEGTFYGNLTAWSQVAIAELLYTGAGQADAYTRSPFYAARLAYGIHAGWPGHLTNRATQNVHQLAPVFGDARRGPTGSALYHRATMLLLGKRFAGTAAAAQAYAVANRRETERTYTAEWGLFDLLFWSPRVQPRDPQALGYREPSLGQVFARSDWSDAATWISFNAGPHLDTHQHYDAGNLTIFKQVDLIVDSGSFDGFGSSHWYNYYARTVAHNTITVIDPAERWEGLWSGVPDDQVANDGGQRTAAPLTPAPTLDGYLANRTAYDHGRIDRYGEGDWGVYVRADITNAYQNPAYQSARPDRERNRVKVTHVGRSVLYLRKSPGRRDAVIVFDRVVSADPSFKKAVLWHAREPFETTASTRQVGEGEFVTDGDESRFEFTTHVTFDERSRKRSGTLHLVALPLDPIRVRQIGIRPPTERADHSPSGNEHYHRHVKDYLVEDPSVVNPRRSSGVQGRPEWPPLNPQEEQWLSNDDLAGGWGRTRLQVEPDGDRLADRFVTVLVPAEASDRTVPRVRLVQSGGAAAVVRLEGPRAEVAIFSADANGAPLPGASLRLPLPDADVYVADLEPGTSYSITTRRRTLGYELSITPGATGARADASGLLRFRLRNPGGATGGAPASSAAAASSMAALGAGEAAPATPAAGPASEPVGAGEGARLEVVEITPSGAVELREWDRRIDAMARSGELARLGTSRDTSFPGRAVERFVQLHDGVPVLGAEIARQVSGTITLSILGRLYEGVAVRLPARLGGDQALAALSSSPTAGSLRAAGEPALVVVPAAGEARLAWVVNAATGRTRRSFFVDGEDGRVLLELSHGWDLSAPLADVPTLAAAARLDASVLVGRTSRLIGRGAAGAARATLEDLLARAAGRPASRTPVGPVRATEPGPRAAFERALALAGTRLGPRGRPAIEAAFYRALVQLLPADPTIAQIEAATVQAARELHGEDGAPERIVVDAWATGRGR